jgi:dihydroneopterin aldolase
MDIVFIQGLKIDCVIGIYDCEREIRQEITLDIEMGFDIKPAAKTDNIEQTLDYKAVSKRLIDFVQNSSFQLVETLAEKITQILLDEFKIKQVKLTLNKGKAVTGAQGVGVIIQRSRG